MLDKTELGTVYDKQLTNEGIKDIPAFKKSVIDEDVTQGKYTSLINKLPASHAKIKYETRFIYKDEKTEFQVISPLTEEAAQI
jgi:hypothetical protein